jgi:hypothetical protein
MQLKFLDSLEQKGQEVLHSYSESIECLANAESREHKFPAGPTFVRKEHVKCLIVEGSVDSCHTFMIQRHSPNNLVTVLFRFVYILALFICSLAQASTASSSICRYRSINYILDPLPQQCPISPHLGSETNALGLATIDLIS